MTAPRRISWSLLSREPFRLFFPGAVLVGMVGVALWPLYFAGLVQFYPGQSHTRLMTYGFFGGFIIGFLGTSLPRMLSVKPLMIWETALLGLLYLAMIGLILAGKTVAGDALFLTVLTAFVLMLVFRLRTRKDVPPPSFVLVALALACAAGGALLSIIVSYSEDAFFWAALQRLLAYQGFMLLPILGVGAFLLPRFFGLANRQDFPESKSPPPGWTPKALSALAAGLLIVASFWMEALGGLRSGPALRLLVTLIYLVREVPLHRPVSGPNPAAAVLRVAFVLLLSGFVAIIVLPAYRVSLLHLTLIGGFGIVTLTVATRVIYGHSGNAALLQQRQRWFWLTVSLMLLGMLTRITGDFLPQVMASHYSYGALIWMAAVLIWSCYVLPKVLVPDPED